MTLLLQNGSRSVTSNVTLLGPFFRYSGYYVTFSNICTATPILLVRFPTIRRTTLRRKVTIDNPPTRQFAEIKKGGRAGAYTMTQLSDKMIYFMNKF